MQSLHNTQDVLVCRNCMVFVGDIIAHLELLTGTPRHKCIETFLQREATREDEKFGKFGKFGNMHLCDAGCGEVYCSQECCEEHLERCHSLLCVGPVPEEDALSHPLVALRVHAMQTNEIFLLVAEVIGHMIKSFLGNGGNVDKARQPYRDFVQEPWWTIVDESGPEGNGADLRSTLYRLCSESGALLREALPFPCPPPLERLLAPDSIGRVVGMFEQNNVGIRVESPVVATLKQALTIKGLGLEAANPNPNLNKGVVTALELLAEVAPLLKVVYAARDENQEDDEDEDYGDESEDYEENENDDGDEARDEKQEDEDEDYGDESEDYEENENDGDKNKNDSHKNEINPAVGGKAKHVQRFGRKGKKSLDEEDGHKYCPDKTSPCCQGVIDNAPVKGPFVTRNREGEPGKDVSSWLYGLIGGSDRTLDASFPPLDGTALYTLICCMNHSCQPNCIVRYPVGTRLRSQVLPESMNVAMVAEVVALEDIVAGEELSQSYVDKAMRLEERRLALKDYGFNCQCARCLQEEKENKERCLK
ncbi:unnamed protein product [Discosporangium mesarthrocarpum]